MFISATISEAPKTELQRIETPLLYFLATLAACGGTQNVTGVIPQNGLHLRGKANSIKDLLYIASHGVRYEGSALDRASNVGASAIDLKQRPQAFRQSRKSQPELKRRTLPDVAIRPRTAAPSERSARRWADSKLTSWIMLGCRSANAIARAQPCGPAKISICSRGWQSPKTKSSSRRGHLTPCEAVRALHWSSALVAPTLRSRRSNVPRTLCCSCPAALGKTHRDDRAQLNETRFRVVIGVVSRPAF